MAINMKVSHAWPQYGVVVALLRRVRAGYRQYRLFVLILDVVSLIVSCQLTGCFRSVFVASTLCLGVLATYMPSAGNAIVFVGVPFAEVWIVRSGYDITLRA